MNAEARGEGAKLAFGVEIHEMTTIVFATTPAKARWIAVRGYWDAYGKTEWPRPRSWREPFFDSNPLKDRESRCYTRDYVMDHHR